MGKVLRFASITVDYVNGHPHTFGIAASLLGHGGDREDARRRLALLQEVIA